MNNKKPLSLLDKITQDLLTQQMLLDTAIYFKNELEKYDEPQTITKEDIRAILIEYGYTPKEERMENE